MRPPPGDFWFNVCGAYGHISRVRGYLVPDTEELFAVHRLWPADEEGPELWCVTHLPTGWSIGREYLEPTTREEAQLHAQRFLKFAKVREWDLHTSKSAVIRQSYNCMTDDEKRRFWEQVRTGEATP